MQYSWTDQPAFWRRAGGHARQAIDIIFFFEANGLTLNPQELKKNNPLTPFIKGE